MIKANKSLFPFFCAEPFTSRPELNPAAAAAAGVLRVFVQIPGDSKQTVKQRAGSIWNHVDASDPNSCVGLALADLQTFRKKLKGFKLDFKEDQTESKC